MRDTIWLRKAQQSDRNEIVMMYKAVIKDMIDKRIYQWDEIYPDAVTIEDDIKKEQLYIAELDSRIVSAFVLNREYDEEYKEGAWRYPRANFYVLHRFCVNPKVQGKKIATRVLYLIEDLLREWGVEAIRLDAFSGNPVALHLYEKSGYKRTGQVNFRKGMFYLLEKWIANSTTCLDPYWDRTVDLLVEINRSLYPEGISSDGIRIVYLNPGKTSTQINSKNIQLKEPSILVLKEGETLRSESGECNFIVYLKPSALNDLFTYECIHSGDIYKLEGTTTYQDFYLLKPIYQLPIEQRILKVDSTLSVSIQAIVNKMHRVLQEQVDGFWPCRSRSYCIQLLFLLQSFMSEFQLEMGMINQETREKTKAEFVHEIIQYMNEHIGDKISIGILEQKFAINRNKINQLFVEVTGETVIAYLIRIRIKLASHLLKNTEVPIYEVGLRVGFTDSSYFTKTFKKVIGKSPKDYREDSLIVSP